MNSTLELTIIPINDAPILLFILDPTVRENPTPVLSGVTQMSFTYTEDDPPLNFGRDIYLRDVDGNISFAILNLTGKTIHFPSPCLDYRIAGKFGGELNLAVWQSILQLPNKKFAKFPTHIIIYICDPVPNRQI